jgi:hypothetical protein
VNLTLRVCPDSHSGICESAFLIFRDLKPLLDLVDNLYVESIVTGGNDVVHMHTDYTANLTVSKEEEDCLVSQQLLAAFLFEIC